MSILGAIQAGVSGDNATLYTKAVMDGFMAIMMTASLGIGVLFSAIPVILYQGTITLLASFLVQFIPKTLMATSLREIGAIGGLMILGIGLNLMSITKIRISNLLPGLVVLISILTGQYFLS